MSELPPLPAIEPWPLAARLATAPESTPWALLAVSSDQIDVIAEDLRDQLASLLETPVELTRAISANELISVSMKAGPLIVCGLESLDAAAWRSVDIGRSRLSRSQTAILVFDERRLPLIVEHAPNFWSWLSSAAWRGYLEGQAPETS